MRAPVELFTDHLGVTRRLLSGPSGGKVASLPTWVGAGHSVLTPSQWWESNRRLMFAYRGWVPDQGVGNSAPVSFARALRTARALAGHPDAPLNPSYLTVQARVHDQPRTNFADLCEICRLVGTVPFRDGEDENGGHADAQPGWVERASPYRFSRVLRCESYPQVISALLLGWTPVFNYRVGPSFEHYDGHGVAGHDYGVSNHCSYADGVKHLPDGRWVLDAVNSFSFAWGPFKDGRCFLDEHHLFTGDGPFDVVVALVDPVDRTVANAA